MVNYFEILGVKQSATGPEIFNQYQILSKQFDGSQLQPLIDEAYNTLKDSNKKAAYIRVLNASNLNTLYEQNERLNSENKKKDHKIESLTRSINKKPKVIYRNRPNTFVNGFWQGLKIPIIIFLALLVIGSILKGLGL